jgi:hypothetical protein
MYGTGTFFVLTGNGKVGNFSRHKFEDEETSGSGDVPRQTQRMFAIKLYHEVLAVRPITNYYRPTLSNLEDQ